MLVFASPSIAAAGEANDGNHFLVFFDSGKADISKDSAATLDGVIAAYREAGAVTISLSGYSDRFGPSVENYRVSTMRAASVRDYLARHGVPERSISVAAHGEANPLVEAADGVMEPQNRRVEIVIGPGSTP